MSNKKNELSTCQEDCLHSLHRMGEVALKVKLSQAGQSSLARRFRKKPCFMYPTPTLESLYKQGLISLEFPDKQSWRKVTIAITEKGLEALNKDTSKNKKKCNTPIFLADG